jgi:branched-chain amino acid transport system ATP-binding protein
MLAIAMALLSRPRLLVLDEPSLGLAPIVVDRLYETVARLHREGLTILLVEQQVFLALELADRAYLLESGHISLHGTAADLQKTDVVRKLYLGA